MNEQEYKLRLDEYRTAVEEYLRGCFDAEDDAQSELYRAMRYSLLAGGKRIRPVLVLEFCRMCGGDWHAALPFAAAIEMVHTYSLIHDDLPCMDNDDYRRGRLTNHKVFGEAGAVLAGDALLTAAFDTASHAEAEPMRALRTVQILSRAAGERGMVGGQQLDLAGEHMRLDEDAIHEIHRLKTGALIEAACKMGVAAADGTAQQEAAAGEYASALGLAFQLRDDLLDVLGDAEKMGKSTGMDGNKNTLVALYGVGACSQMIEQYTKQAIGALASFAQPEFLTRLAQRLADREY